MCYEHQQETVVNHSSGDVTFTAWHHSGTRIEFLSVLTQQQSKNNLLTVEASRHVCIEQ